MKNKHNHNNRMLVYTQQQLHDKAKTVEWKKTPVIVFIVM